MAGIRPPRRKSGERVCSPLLAHYDLPLLFRRSLARAIRSRAPFSASAFSRSNSASRFLIFARSLAASAFASRSSRSAAFRSAMVAFFRLSLAARSWVGEPFGIGTASASRLKAPLLPKGRRSTSPGCASALCTAIGSFVSFANPLANSPLPAPQASSAAFCDGAATTVS